MKRLVAKMRRLRVTRWNNLTRGEKVMKIVMSLVKVAAVVAAVVAVASLVMAVAAGIVVAMAIAGAISGGLENASYAYRSGDRYIRFR